MDVTGTMAVQAAAPTGSRAALEFEALVIARAFEEMLASVETRADPPGASVWRGLLAQAVAGAVTAGGGIGVARQLDAAIDGYAGAADRAGR